MVGRSLGHGVAVSERRNIGILAHIDAGKTTLTEALLHATGTIRYPGAVEHGSTATDWRVQEQERGITIGSAAIGCRWRDVDITIVDTPGHVDFTIEVARCLRVLDGAVLVISGPDGVQAQTETVWHQAERHGLPMLAFVNKLDRDGMDLQRLDDEIRDRLGIEPLPLFLPLEGQDIEVIDVVSDRVFGWERSSLVRRQRAPRYERALTSVERGLRAEAWERLIDTVADHDDGFAELVLDGRQPSPVRSCAAIARAMSAKGCLPLVFGAARFGVGVSLMADAVVDLLPSPARARRPSVYALSPCVEVTLDDASAPPATACFVFKTEQRRRGNRLVFVRVFQGEVRQGQVLSRLPGGGTFAPSAIVAIDGGDEHPVDCLESGAIGGLVAPDGAAYPATGETLGAPDLGFSYEPGHRPEPVISVILEASDLATHQVMQQALDAAAMDDPSLRVFVDPQTGQTALGGMGELHLALVVERLVRDQQLAVKAHAPSVRLRQTVPRPISGEASVVDRVSGGSVTVAVSLAPRNDSRVDIVYQVVAPRRVANLRALESGIHTGLGLDGSKQRHLINVTVTISRLAVIGAQHPPVVYRNAMVRAINEALQDVSLIDVQPWGKITIVTPEVAVGRVVGDLSRRGGRVRATAARGGSLVIDAEAPIAAMLGYATELRSMTGGRGVFTIAPHAYRPIA